MRQGITKKRAGWILHSIEDAAIAQTQRLANEIREQYVLPACRKHRLEFISGMGAWSFNDPRADVYSRGIEREDARRYGLVRVFDILSMPTLWDSQDIGDWVSDVRETDW